MSVAEVVYTTSYEPDPGDTRAVLAFVLLSADQFTRDPCERSAVARSLMATKREAILRWQKARRR